MSEKEKIRMTETVNAIIYTEKKTDDQTGERKVVRKDISEHKEGS